MCKDLGVMEDMMLKMVQSKWMEHTDAARRGVVRKERQVPSAEARFTYGLLLT